MFKKRGATFEELMDAAAKPVTFGEWLHDYIANITGYVIVGLALYGLAHLIIEVFGNPYL